MASSMLRGSKASLSQGAPVKAPRIVKDVRRWVRSRSLEDDEPYVTVDVLDHLHDRPKRTDAESARKGAKKLANSDLRWAELEECDLDGADFRDADMRDVNLRNANLHNANLSRANLTNDDWRGAK